MASGTLAKRDSSTKLPARVMADKVVAKLHEAERALQHASTIHQAKIVADVAAAQEVFAHRQRLGETVTGYAHEIKIYALTKLGELLREMPKATGGQPYQKKPGKATGSSLVPVASTLADLGLDKKTAHVAQQLADLPVPVRDAIAKRETSFADARRDQKRKEVRKKLDDLKALEIEAPTGQYDVIVIDPPWPMERIERDERPNQVGFDYDPMSDAQLSELKIPAADSCHVWLWTTQRFLPMAIWLLKAWGLKYVCTFVWHKPGGFQPVGLPQFNCEFALYARQGSPMFLDTKSLPTCFEAPRGRHSEKPEQFYEMVRRVTGGRRLDMFNRRKIDGFTGWGKEAV